MAVSRNPATAELGPSPASLPPGPPTVQVHLASTCMGALLMVGCHGASESPSEEAVRPAPDPASPRPVAGTLRVSVYGEVAPASNPGALPPLRHTGVWVNNRTYQGHSDNDLRGFLDGRFRHGWNQASQIHVRLGRLHPWGRAVGGERELFRHLHRWDGVRLPEGVNILGAELTLSVEVGTDRELDLLLYEVKKDWVPGGGGVEENNNSAPKPGEVWWNERMRDVDAWGLPAEGFASDRHPEADTPETALAHAVYAPGDSSISFRSSRLATYVEERVAAEEPLLFMVKLSDHLEDEEGTIIASYSSNYGDSENSARRPRLRLEWEGPPEVSSLERRIILEPGRSLRIPRIPVEGVAAVSASFLPEEGSSPPRIMVRGGRGDEVSDWTDAQHPVVGTRDWDWVEVLVAAQVNPIPVGSPFQAELRDTWVTTAPPEEQDVPWVFVSPSGVVHEVTARYVSDFTWRVQFLPDEVGPWVYQSHQQFSDDPYETAVGRFDVIVDDHDSALYALERLIERIEGSKLRPGRERVEAFGPKFYRLQRGLMQLQDPESFSLAGESGTPNRIMELLDAVRYALSGAPPEGPRLPLQDGQKRGLTTLVKMEPKVYERERLPVLR